MIMYSSFFGRTLTFKMTLTLTFMTKHLTYTKFLPEPLNQVLILKVIFKVVKTSSNVLTPTVLILLVIASYHVGSILSPHE